MSSSPAPESALKPTLGVFDVVAITVSAVTPASSVFVIAPFAIQQAGTGAFWAFALAGVLALMFAWCYAELGRAHSTAGGEYVYAKRGVRRLGRLRHLPHGAGRCCCSSRRCSPPARRLT
ncbi:amino acid permease [Pseudomonas aeruginosa]|nr:amino acid permease [Pseudomonas aeruginosa]